MNHIYRLIWSQITQTWVATAEIAKSCGKASSGTVGPGLTLALAFVATPGWALDVASLPTGGQVVAGSASISQAANVLTVQQNTQRAAARRPMY